MTGIKDNLRLKKGKLKTYDYKKIWKRINSDRNSNNRKFVGAFVRYDDTPRRGKNSSIVIGDSPQLFENNLKQLLKKECVEYVLLTAWNEWGEGAYLESDTEFGNMYLDALKRAVEDKRE